jgi:ATP-dependent DNA ligase
MNRELLMLARDFDPDKHTIADAFVSVKLDGQRCFWDGGISRGVPKREVPWANNAKDERYKEPPVATGLWSRYGNVIHAPEWFLNELPRGVMTDGELYLGRGKFQESRSIISTIEPGNGWKQIIYRVFDLPSPNVLFQQGKINNPNFSHYIDEAACEAFLRERQGSMKRSMLREVLSFDKTVERMAALTSSQNQVWRFMNQVRLPSREKPAREKLYELLDKETSIGGEGLMVRLPSSIWVPKRVTTLLKVKKFCDNEGRIVGFISGQGKLLGMLGALEVQWNGQTFRMSGFTDEERKLFHSASGWARQHPDCKWPGSDSPSVKFKYGDEIRFRYLTLTNDGKPREPRYFR